MRQPDRQRQLVEWARQNASRYTRNPERYPRGVGQSTDTDEPVEHERKPTDPLVEAEGRADRLQADLDYATRMKTAEMRATRLQAELDATTKETDNE